MHVGRTLLSYCKAVGAHNIPVESLPFTILVAADFGACAAFPSLMSDKITVVTGRHLAREAQVHGS